MKNIYILIFVILVFSCNKTEDNSLEGHDHDSEPAETEAAHSHDSHLEELISHSFYTENSEFFVQFQSLMIHHDLKFTIHLTETKNFKPIENAKLTVSLVAEGKGIRTKVENSTEAGIYNAFLNTEKAGIYDLWIELEAESGKEKAIIKGVEIFETPEKALEAHFHIADGDKISYLKEQAWNSEFSSLLIEPSTYKEVIHTSGEILHAQGDETIISATTSGFVFFSKTLINGFKVIRGTTLMSISGKDLTDDNLEIKFYSIKANYTKNKIEYEKAEKLFSEKLIIESEYLDKKYQYENSKIAFDKISSNFSSLGQKIKAPKLGFVKQIYITQGQFVEAGQPLLSISQNRKLIIKADVSQEFFAKIPAISTANFKTSYNDKVYSIEELNGKLLSYDKSIGENSHFASVFFEIDNSENLMSGSFVEVFLKSKNIFEAIVIPKTAILEEYGKYFVYVQISGDKFEKRYIKIGGNDGKNARIISGLAFSERVVTKGAFEIKLSAMSGSLPAHAHNH